ncbi:MAG TPA: hypothetical protein VFV93_11490, partial [Thermomicrobiales bacterium]|nr:hypothetical protein [Thermomicrobiales bacterium]
MTVQRDAAQDALIQIEKVLRLEERQGFRDASATIGLARFVGERTARLLGASDAATRTQVQELDALLADYATLLTGERARSVSAARSIVAGLLQRSPNGRTPVAPPQRQVATPRPARQAPASASTVSPSATPRPVAAATQARPAPAKRPTGRISSLSDSVRLLPGVGEARVKLLEQLGVRTVRDLLRLYPRRHIDYSNVQKIGSLLFGHISTNQGTVQSIESSRTR